MQLKVILRDFVWDKARKWRILENVAILDEGKSM